MITVAVEISASGYLGRVHGRGIDLGPQFDGFGRVQRMPQSCRLGLDHLRSGDMGEEGVAEVEQHGPDRPRADGLDQRETHLVTSRPRSVATSTSRATWSV